MKARELAELLLRVPEADVSFLIRGKWPPRSATPTDFPFNAEANAWVIIPPAEETKP